MNKSNHNLKTRDMGVPDYCQKLKDDFLIMLHKQSRDIKLTAKEQGLIATFKGYYLFV